MAEYSWVLLIFLGTWSGVRGTLNDTKIVTNCTVDDLRNINNQYKLENGSSSLGFVFSQCNLPRVPDAFFVSVRRAESIEFVNSNISAIAPYALSGLHKLEQLTVVSNQNLTKFDQWTPHNLDKLQSLDLHANGIQDLDTFALRRYPKLTQLNLRQNIIGEIPIGFFDFSLNIETLILADNVLQRIESYTFKALLRLTDLNLAFNQIASIDSYSFTTTTRLRTLRLNGNRLGTVNAMVFYNLARLEYLNLSENALNNNGLEEDAFQQNSQLLQLDVSHNAITTVQMNALNGLKSLQVSPTKIV